MEENNFLFFITIANFFNMTNPWLRRRTASEEKQEKNANRCCVTGRCAPFFPLS